MRRDTKTKKAFTIVELLVVIVIIGILAAISLVSYSGISNKAITAGLQSDLSNNHKKLEMYKVEHGYYPNSLDSNYCPLTPEPDTRYCLKASRGNTLTYTGGNQSFELINTHTASGLSYKITEDGIIVVAGNNGPVSSSYAVVWGGDNYDFGNDIIQTSDGGYAITGETSSYGAGNNDMFLAKYSSDGTLSWSKTWGGINNESGNSLTQTSDGGYAITGETSSYGAGDKDMFLVKYTTDGVLAWSKTWGGVYGDLGNCIIQTPDGGYAITGETISYSVGGGTDMFLAKYSSEGTLAWSKTWGGVNDESGKSLVQASDGGYAITGVTGSYGDGDMFITKYTIDGTPSWIKTWGGVYSDGGYSIVQTSDEGYAITGVTDSYGAGGDDILLIKYSSDGALSWSKTWGGVDYESGRSIVQTSDGGYAITGVTDSYGAGGNDILLIKYSSDGALSWSKTWGGAGSESGSSIVQTSDGGYAITGVTDSYGSGASGAFVAKFKSDGSIINCSSPMYQSPTTTVTSPTATVGSPAVSVNNPSATVTSPTGTITSPSATTTTIVE